MVPCIAILPFDKLSEESESDDVQLKESDRANGAIHSVILKNW